MTDLTQCILKSTSRIKVFLLFAYIAVSPSYVFATDNSPFTVKLSALQAYPGDVILLQVFPSHDITSVQYTFDNQTINLHHNTDNALFFAFVAIDLDESPGKKNIALTITTVKNQAVSRQVSLTVLKKDFPVQHLSLPELVVTLSKKSLSRHKREKEIVNSIFTNSNKAKLWGTPFIRPVSGALQTPFGVRRVLNKKPRSSHSGIDFKAPLGTPVAASSDGIVTYVGNHFFSGNSVFIDHGMGIITMYFHLDKILVSKGQVITRGQMIGQAGSTGRATGPHLHFGMRLHNKKVDPLVLFKLFENSDLLRK